MSKWSEEEKETLIKMVHINPLQPNWKEISIALNRSEDRVKKIYHEVINPFKHVQVCINTIDYKMITALLETSGYECISCANRFYDTPHNWKGESYCEECHDQKFGCEIKERWRMIQEYSIQQKKTRCNLCHKNALFDNTLSKRFHYDHVDMFDKSCTICIVVQSGAPLEEAYLEIEKCQLLCISCHAMITRTENLCGFTRLKKQMTRYVLNDRIREDTVEQFNESFSEMYSTFMKKIYDTMREQH